MKVLKYLSSLKTLKGFLILVFTIRFLQSLCALKHGDALYYHLVGGRYWVETSLIEMTKSFHPFLLAGLFDYFYVIPNFLFGPTLMTQIVGQNMHFLFSMGAASLLTYKYFKGSAWAYLVPMMILTISKSQDFFFYAKNDGVVASLGLLAAILIIEKDFLVRIKGFKRAALVGVVLGLMPAVKMYALFASASLGIIYIFYNRKKVLNIAVVCLFGLLAWSPILLRNYWLLETPFFPGLLNMFPGNLTPGMINYLTNSLNATVGVERFLEHLKTAFLGKAIFALSIPLFIANLKLKKEGNAYFIAVLLFMFFYAGLNGGWVFDRYYFVCYFWTAFFLAKSLKQYVLKPWVIPLVLVLILVDGRLDLGISRVKKTFKLYAQSENSTQVVRKISKFTEFWDFVEPNTLIISDRASEIFYAPEGVRMHNYTESREAEFLYNCSTDDVKKLRSYSYAIIERKRNNPCYELLTTKGKRLHKVFDYTLYDIREITTSIK